MELQPRKRWKSTITVRPKVSWFDKLAKWATVLGSTQKIVGGIGAAIVVVLFAVVVIRSTTTEAVLIQPIALPESLRKLGHTPASFTELLVSRANAMLETPNSPSAPRVAVQRDQMELKLPGSELTTRVATQVVRVVRGHGSRDLEGEVSQGSGSFKIVIRPHVGPAQTRTVNSNADRLVDELAESGARAAMATLSPGVLLNYLINEVSRKCARASNCSIDEAEAALLALSDATRQTEDRAELLIIWSWLYLKRPDPELAIEKAQLAIKLAPNSHGGHAALGQALNAANRSNAAYAAFDRALQLGDSNLTTRIGIGVALMGSKRNNEALDYFKDLSQTESSEYVRINLALTLANLKRDEEALGVFRQIDASGAAGAQTYYSWGNVLHRLKREDEALARYSQAISKDPSHADALYNAATVSRRVGRSDEALELLSRVQAIEGPKEDVLMQMGEILYGSGRRHEAGAKFQRAVLVASSSPRIYESWGISLAKAGLLDDAISKFKIATELDPKFASGYSSWAIALSRGNRELNFALGLAEKAVSLQPSSSYIRTDYAAVLFSNGRYCEAKREANAVLAQGGPHLRTDIVRAAQNISADATLRCTK